MEHQHNAYAVAFAIQNPGSHKALGVYFFLRVTNGDTHSQFTAYLSDFLAGSNPVVSTFFIPA